jgi:hypothetical protein
MGETPPVNQIYAPGSPGSSSDSHFELDSEGEAELDYAALHREVAKEYFEKRENLTRGMLEGDSEDSIEVYQHVICLSICSQLSSTCQEMPL